MYRKRASETSGKQRQQKKELMNESIVDYLIKKVFPVLEVPRVTQSVELSKDEENILRYAWVL